MMPPFYSVVVDRTVDQDHPMISVHPKLMPTKEHLDQVIRDLTYYVDLLKEHSLADNS